MDIAALLAATIVAGTPLLLATLGELVTEKAGNLNLGVEGLMLLGAMAGFIMANKSGNPFLSLIAAGFAGAVGAAIYGFLTVTLRANQVVTGLTLTIFGTGVSSLIGQRLVGQILPESIKNFFAPINIPILSNIPFIGKVLFQQDLFVYFSLLLAIILALYIYKTNKGLNLSAVGENPYAAEACSINVILYKYIHILLGGALCGLGGAYLSIVYVPTWQDNITAGRGWIAVALVIFASWNPIKAILGAYLFGCLDIIGFRLTTPFISKYFLDMLPYLVTILVLVFISSKKSKKNAPPKFLGLPYFREER